jgi:hypothetical protein
VAIILPILNNIAHTELIETHTKQNPIIRYLTKILLNETRDDWMREAQMLLSSNDSDIFWCLAFIHVYFRVKSWSEFCDYRIDSSDGIKIPLCLKMDLSLGETDSWMAKVQEIFYYNASQAMDALSASKIEWKVLGDHYLANGEKNLALNCYLQDSRDEMNRLDSFNILFASFFSIFHKTQDICCHKRMCRKN